MPLSQFQVQECVLCAIHQAGHLTSIVSVARHFSAKRASWRRSVERRDQFSLMENSGPHPLDIVTALNGTLDMPSIIRLRYT